MINPCFLPQDTRTAELISGWALLVLGVFCVPMLGINLDSDIFVKVQVIPFWAVIFMLLGMLQVSAITMYPRAEVLRIILSWFNGALWIWMSLAVDGVRMDPTAVPTFLLGFANLYAFVINSLGLKHHG